MYPGETIYSSGIFNKWSSQDELLSDLKIFAFTSEVFGHHGQLSVPSSFLNIFKPPVLFCYLV